MSCWQVAMISVASIWVGVSWIEDVVEKIVARRLEAHLIRLELMLVERRFIHPDPPWPDHPNDAP